MRLTKLQILSYKFGARFKFIVKFSNRSLLIIKRLYGREI
ncbi:hypothetical protein CSUNSWCD_867 [Campylobacter showae CSUNSWCD]|uniref:Uncharacterized protein n=1 Tax=Campylobacter showae CSUNSWCD TaxID=1244083 RepID=M5IPC7_9BACT|nr:hypothetical protein CSUNSWCD_867 [Campylobacter showae CSUNSWCD]